MPTNILLLTEDKTLRAALEILTAEQGGRLLSPSDADPGAALSPDCILADLDHPAPASYADPASPGSAPVYTISFEETRRPTLLRPFGEELFAAVLRSAEKEKEKNGEPDEALALAQPTFAGKNAAALFFDGSAVYTDTAGKKITLSEKERQVFRVLYDAREKPVRVRELAEAVWGSADAENNVRVYIRYLRKKLESITDRKYIQTVRGGAFLLRRSSEG